MNGDVDNGGDVENSGDGGNGEEGSITRRALLLTVAGLVSSVVQATTTVADAAPRTTKRTARKVTTTTRKAASKGAVAREQVTNLQVLPVPQQVLDDLGQYVGGVWRGNWQDRRGGSGTSTMEFIVDKAIRTAKIRIIVNGPALGVAGLATEKVEIVLDGRPSTRSVDTRLFGVARMEEAETSSWRATVSDIPGGVIASIDALLSPGERGSLHLVYEAVRRDGTRAECAHAWSRDGSVKAFFRSAQAGAAAAATGSVAASLHRGRGVRHHRRADGPADGERRPLGFRAGDRHYQRRVRPAGGGG